MLLALMAATDLQGAESFTGTLKKIIDGDSLLVSNGRRNIEVRLYGIDCPEYRQPYSQAAKKYVKSMIGRGKVRVQPYYNDPYGRKVSMVYTGDKVLNGELVEAGFAWVYPAYCRKPICREWEKKEKRAKRDKRGLWQEPDAIPPWKWKRMQKRR